MCSPEGDVVLLTLQSAAQAALALLGPRGKDLLPEHQLAYAKLLEEATGWASSAADDASRLRLARALALRPCANLACANVLASGPGKRCSGCRTLRFCRCALRCGLTCLQQQSRPPACSWCV